MKWERLNHALQPTQGGAFISSESRGSRRSAMKTLHNSKILFSFILLLTGCASQSSIDSTSQQSRIVGTWRWVSSDEKQITSPFHIRYYADGTLAWWPALEAKFSINGVTYSRYSLEGDILDTAPDSTPDRATFHRFKVVKINGDKMIVVGEESDTNIYQRVLPNLEPGK